VYVIKGKHYLDQRVDVTPSPPLRGETMTIRYSGLLAKSGADRVFIHYGFDGWKNVADQEMRREPDGSFAISVPARGNHEINFCFRDAANNWDNNSGWNWASDIR
jgi:hypothetical protein